MPGAVPITSTIALTNVTLPYIVAIADHGLIEAVHTAEGLALGVNVIEGKVTSQPVAEATGNPWFPLESLLPIGLRLGTLQWLRPSRRSSRST